MIYLEIEGEAISMGSKSAFPFQDAKGKCRCQLVDQHSKQLKPFQAAVRLAATEAWKAEPFDGAVCVFLRCYFERPSAHFRTKGYKSTDEVKPNFLQAEKQTQPDLDKLQRAVGDALEGTVITNDARIVDWVSQKRYVGPGEYARVEIEMYKACEMDDRVIAEVAQPDLF